MVAGKIGVLALQGDFQEHLEALERLGVEGKAVRLPQDLDGIKGIIIPGGESTSIGRLMVTYGLAEPLKDIAKKGLPIWGTCAGMIIMAKEVLGLTFATLGLMDITVKRNAFGRQVDSFELPLSMPLLGREPLLGVFIRAPWVEKVGPEVEVLVRLPDKRVVAVKERNLLATAFHPELTQDLRLHRFFLEMANSST